MKLALLLAVLLTATAMAGPPNDQPEKVTIPLDQIWAYNMPGTRQMSTAMQDRPPEYISAEGPLLSEIRRSLSRRSLREVTCAEAGFAVRGNNMNALHRAHSVLVKKEKPSQSFPAGSKITAVFFSYTFGRSVHVEKIERLGNVVEIYYRFVPHMTANATEHFALIPFGELPSGDYQVEIRELPLAQEHVDLGYGPIGPDWGRRVVCRPFAFTVEP